MNNIKAPHPIYFLTMRRTKGQDRASLTAIKDESAGKRFACVFVSFQDAQEFMVANDLTFDTWKISQAHSPDFVQCHCYEARREGIYEAVINPPPVIRGVWRILPTQQLVAWRQPAKEPLLAWAGYEVPPIPSEEARK